MHSSYFTELALGEDEMGGRELFQELPSKDRTRNTPGLEASLSNPVLPPSLSFCVLLRLPQPSLSICSDPSKFEPAYGSRHPPTIWLGCQLAECLSFPLPNLQDRHLIGPTYHFKLVYTDGWPGYRKGCLQIMCLPFGPLIWDKGQTRSLEHNYLEGFRQQKDFFRGAFGWDRLR